MGSYIRNVDFVVREYRWRLYPFPIRAEERRAIDCTDVVLPNGFLDTRYVPLHGVHSKGILSILVLAMISQSRVFNAVCL